MTSAQEHPVSSSLPSGRDISLRWDLRLPKTLESSFRKHFFATSQPIVLIACPLMLAVYLLAFLVEYQIAAEQVIENTWQPRLLCILATVVVFVSAIHAEYQRHMEATIIFMVAVFTIAHIHMGAIVPHHLAYIYFYIILLGILFMATLFRITFWRSVAVSAVVLVASALGMFFISQRDPEEALIAFSFITTSTIIILTGQYFHERLQRKFFLAESVLDTHRSELHTANAMLETQVTEDGLTGAINRRGMDSQLAELFHRMQRGLRDAPESIAILLFDIDDFKPYNDTYGHQAGDDCLKKIAAVPRGMIQRASDFVARYGGEEFMVVLVGTQLGDALVFAERLRSRVEQLGIPHEHASSGDVVTISIGVACTMGARGDSGTLIAQADEALYKAKHAGRNCVASYAESGEIRLHIS